MMAFTIGFMCKENNIYKVNGVSYEVESRFSKTNDFKDKLGRYLTGEFTDLKLYQQEDKIEEDSVCTTAGKEDQCS